METKVIRPTKFANIIGSFFFIIGQLAFASQESAQSFTLDGRLYSDGAGTTAMVDPNVQLKLQILNAAQDCILYEEAQAVNTSSSNGYFTIQVGSATGASKRSANDSGLTMQQIYSNTNTIVGKLLSNGSACSYTPNSGDQRYVRIQVTPSSDGIAKIISPNMTLDSVPNAMVAERAESVQGYSASQLLKVNTTAPANLSQANLESVFSTTNYPRLTSLLSVAPSNYVQTSTNGAAGIPQVAGNPSSGLTEGQFWYDSTAHAIKFYNGTASQALGVSGAGITSLTAGNGLTGGTITTAGQTIAVDSGTTANKVVQLDGSAKLPAVDGSALTNLSATNIATGTLGNAVVVNTTGNITTSGYVASAEDRTNSVKVFKASTANYVEFLAPSGIASPYSLTLPAALPGTSNQILASTSAGVLSWVPLSTGVVGNQATLTNGKIWIGDSSSKAQENSVSGDLTLSNAGAAKVVAIQNVAVSSTAPTLSGQVLRYDLATTKYVPAFVAMTDLRSSTTGSSAFASSCTSSQTLTYNSVGDTMSCQNISLAASQISSGTLGVSNGGTGTTSLPGTFALNGGQAGAVTIGPSDANSLTLNTNGSPRLTVLSGGNVGIGTTSPNSSLDVRGPGLFWNQKNGGSVPGALTSNYNAAEFLLNVSNLVTIGDVDGGPAITLYRTSAGTRTGRATRIYQPNSSADLYFDRATTATTYGTETFTTSMAIQGSSGYVGIGTTTPSWGLDVIGGGRFAVSGNPVLLIERTGSASNSTIQYKNSSGSSTSWYAGLSSLGSFGFKYGDADVGTSPNFVISSNGNVGIGTTSPAATLDVKGHVGNSGSAATVGSCGTSPSISGNDNRGKVTVGTGGTTSCVITFNSAYTTAPICTVSWSGSSTPTTMLSAVEATGTLTVYFSASVSGSTFAYHCTQ